jgi:hypothetical protein
MTPRRASAPFLLFALLVMVGLLVSGMKPIAIRSSSIGVPDAKTVAIARPHHQICEGSVRSEYSFRSVVLWATYLGGAPLVQVWRDASGKRTLISQGLVEPSPSGSVGPYTARLTSSVGPDVAVSVCVLDAGGKFELRGSAPSYGDAVIIGSKPPRAFSLVTLRSDQHSFLGSLSLAFSRASLFRPSWVGTWTFWALLIALLGTVPLTAVAISAAIRSEADQAD